MGGATSSWLKGDDPLKGGAINGAASELGYGAGKLIRGPFDNVLNPNRKTWEWVNISMGISKPLPANSLPGGAGNITGATTTEYSNDQAGKKLGGGK